MKDDSSFRFFFTPKVALFVRAAVLKTPLKYAETAFLAFFFGHTLDEAPRAKKDGRLNPRGTVHGLRLDGRLFYPRIDAHNSLCVLRRQKWRPPVAAHVLNSIESKTKL